MLATLLVATALPWAVSRVPGFNFVLFGHFAAGRSRRSAWAAVLGVGTATSLSAPLVDAFRARLLAVPWHVPLSR